MRKRTVVHIITGLSTGGAEMMLYKILSTLDRENYESIVISLLDKGLIGPRIEELGVRVFALNMRRGIPHPGCLLRLRRLLRQLGPDIIHGWMYHGNIAATLASWSVRSKVPVLWNIRQSLYKIGNERLLTRLVIRASSVLAFAPECIVYNSRISAEQHERMGYRKSARRLIPNGFDTREFRPDSGRRASIRNELGIPDEVFLIGMIARFHPMKDHAGFLEAAAVLRKKGIKARFLLAGHEVDGGNPVIMATIKSLGLEEDVVLLGERTDVSFLNPAVDIACSSSAWGEAFPNVIGEAMACGVPCVATDVGDSSWIIADTGYTVPPGDPHALAAAWERLATMNPFERGKLGTAARNRVVKYFELEKITKQYEQLYRSFVPLHE
jgi:glycosyltransferase involved in cell wall biosynthesis